MLRIIGMSVVGSCAGIAACCVGAADLYKLDAIGVLGSYLAGGSIGGLCAAGVNSLVDW